MKITIFQSDKGDCLLVSHKQDGKNYHMLVDGGMRKSYKQHVAQKLSRLREQGERLNLVYVSHIDQDHISGVLQLFDDLKDWRVHDFQVSHNNPQHPQPESPRPPEIEALWHNAFHEQLGDNTGPIEEMLAATATILSRAADEDTLAAAAEHMDLVTSQAEAIQLSRRAGLKQLNVPLNPQFNKKLMCITKDMPSTIPLGGMSIYVIGPSQEDLEALREEWNAWLAKSQKQLRTLQRKAFKDEADIRSSGTNSLSAFAQAQAQELHDRLALRLKTTGQEGGSDKRLGKRKNVTLPNLASLMLLVEEGENTLLLTGDGHGKDILKGLKHHNKLNQNGEGLHVTALKIQHHGATANIDEEFCRAITADHYIFCGNGEHENPEFLVVKAILDSRLSTGPNRSKNKESGKPFKLWFNSSESETSQQKAKDHMRELQRQVEDRRKKNPDRFTYEFLSGKSFFELEL